MPYKYKTTTSMLVHISEMADDDDDYEDHHHQQQQPSTPFWLKDTAFRSSSKSSLATLSSIMFSSGSVILILVIAAAMIFVFFFIPSILNLISQIFRPNSVKRSWDSLNLVLILFAIICAFLSRVNSSYETPKSASSGRFRFPYREPEQGCDTDNDMYSYSNRMTTTRLRTSSSYPDLRHQLDYTSTPIAPWSSDDYIDRIRSNRIRNVAYRFSDDTQLRSYQFTDTSWNVRSKPATETADEIHVENSNPAEAAKQVPSPPQQPLTETSTRVNHKSTRTEPNPNQLLPLPSPTRAYTVRRKTKRVNRSFDDAAFETQDEEQIQNPTYPYTAESDLSERKKSGGATKDFLSSFYGNQKRKKKRERQRSSENFEQLLKQPLVHSSSTTTTPPPPPPLSPPSVFQNMFSTKKSKNKKTASDPSDSITYTTKIALAQPPIPTPSTISTSHNILTGNESPLYGIPEPPPLPPFGMPVWKFVVEGDYVRLKSMNSSRSGSPGPEDDSIRASSETGESMWSETDDNEETGGESPVSTPATETAAFCPSPDVNTKADNFIAKFRAGLKMEKVNSGKGVGLSRLGPVANVNNHN